MLHAASLPAFADEPPICTLSCPEVEGGAGVIEATYAQGQSDHVDGRGDATHGYAPGRSTWLVVDEDMAPACAGNSLNGSESLCGSAVNSCPNGLIRFWVWHRTTQFVQSSDGEVASRVTVPWHREPLTYCLGADDPGVPTIARVIDQVQRDFKNLPLRRESVRSDPGPRTLVNIDTAFSAGTTQLQTFDPVLLGIGVHIAATPKRWHWTWGDGTTAVTDTPGVPKQPVVTHRYTRAGDVQVSVVVEWTGTFSVGDDPTQYEIQSPATVPAEPTTVRVRTARSQLVAG
jgi:hypothetical protein